MYNFGFENYDFTGLVGTNLSMKDVLSLVLSSAVYYLGVSMNGQLECNEVNSI